MKRKTSRRKTKSAEKKLGGAYWNNGAELGPVSLELAGRYWDLRHYLESLRDQYRGILDDPKYAGLLTLISAERQCAFLEAKLSDSGLIEQSAEAVRIFEDLKRGSQKGAIARREQAAPIHKAVCKRFRELRKTTPKKTVRYLRIAEEFGMSERHVQRIVNDADLD